MKYIFCLLPLFLFACNKDLGLEKFNGKGTEPFISEIILSRPEMTKDNLSNYWYLPVNKDERICNPTNETITRTVVCPGLDSQPDTVVTVPPHMLRHFLVTTNVQYMYDQTCNLKK